MLLDDVEIDDHARGEVEVPRASSSQNPNAIILLASTLVHAAYVEKVDLRRAVN